MKNFVVIILLLLVGLGVIFVGYKLYKRQGRVAYTNSLYNTPIGTISNTASANNITLNISSPTDGETVNTSTVEVTGKTVPGAEVSVNEVDTSADKDGNFGAKISLDEGENTVTVVANDVNGNYLEKEITVIFDSGK